MWQSDPAWPICIYTHTYDPTDPYPPHMLTRMLHFSLFLQAYVCVQAYTLLSHHHSLPCLTLTVTLVSHFMPYRYTCITCFVRLLPPMIFASRNVLLVSTSFLSLYYSIFSILLIILKHFCLPNKPSWGYIIFCSSN